MAYSKVIVSAAVCGCVSVGAEKLEQKTFPGTRVLAGAGAAWAASQDMLPYGGSVPDIMSGQEAQGVYDAVPVGGYDQRWCDPVGRNLPNGGGCKNVRSISHGDLASRYSKYACSETQPMGAFAEYPVNGYSQHGDESQHGSQGDAGDAGKYTENEHYDQHANTFSAEDLVQLKRIEAEALSEEAARLQDGIEEVCEERERDFQCDPGDTEMRGMEKVAKLLGADGVCTSMKAQLKQGDILGRMMSSFSRDVFTETPQTPENVLSMVGKAAIRAGYSVGVANTLVRMVGMGLKQLEHAQSSMKDSAETSIAIEKYLSDPNYVNDNYGNPSNPAEVSCLLKARHKFSADAATMLKEVTDAEAGHPTNNFLIAMSANLHTIALFDKAVEKVWLQTAGFWEKGVHQWKKAKDWMKKKAGQGTLVVKTLLRAAPFRAFQSAPSMQSMLEPMLNQAKGTRTQGSTMIETLRHKATKMIDVPGDKERLGARLQNMEEEIRAIFGTALKQLEAFSDFQDRASNLVETALDAKRQKLDRCGLEANEAAAKQTLPKEMMNTPDVQIMGWNNPTVSMWKTLRESTRAAMQNALENLCREESWDAVSYEWSLSEGDRANNLATKHLHKLEAHVSRLMETHDATEGGPGSDEDQNEDRSEADGEAVPV